MTKLVFHSIVSLYNFFLQFCFYNFFCIFNLISIFYEFPRFTHFQTNDEWMGWWKQAKGKEYKKIRKIIVFSTFFQCYKISFSQQIGWFKFYLVSIWSIFSIFSILSILNILIVLFQIKYIFSCQFRYWINFTFTWKTNQTKNRKLNWH